MSQPLSPSFASSTTAILTLPNLSLNDDDQRILSGLTTRLFEERPFLELRGLYYDGMQKIEDLGISIPPQLQKLRTVMGWPQTGIDAIEERCIREGFRYPGTTEIDDDLESIWQANNLDAEAPLAHLDALVYGRSYVLIGPGDDTTNGEPLITPESPLNMTCSWDARLRRPTAALQLYLDTDYTSDMYGQEIAALYLPDRIVLMSRQPSSVGSNIGKWDIVDVDTHNLGRLPIARIANRQRLAMREGMSEITPAWMNTVDSACRTLLGMEVGREFHAAPRRYILGAAEDAFVKADGTSVAAWEAYLGKIWALERDEEGNVPTVGEFKTGDPAAYTKLIDSYTRVMAGLLAVPPHYLGMISDGNPASADAIRSSEARLVKRVERKMVAFGDGWEEAMRLALLVRDGTVPDRAHRLETDWVDPNTPTPLQTAQAVTLQINQGMISPTSPTALKKVGWTAVERLRIAQELKDNPVSAELAGLVNSEGDKLIVGGTRLEKAADFASLNAGIAATNPPAPASPAAPAE